MLGLIVLMLMISTIVVNIYISNEIRDDYASKAKNISGQFGYNVECQMQDIEKCIVELGENILGKASASIYSDFQQIFSSEICLSSITVERGAETVSYGRDNVSRKMYIGEKELSKIKSGTGQWVLIGNTVFAEDYRVGYIYVCSDGSVITADIDVNRIIKFINESNFLKDAKVLLACRENTILLWGDKNDKDEDMIRSTYFQSNRNVWMEYYIPVPITKTLMPWYFIIMIVAIVLLVLSIYVIKRYSQGIYVSINKIDRKIFEYINIKRGDKQ